MSKSSSSTASPVVMKISEWNVTSHKYMQPKINKQGGKSITLISKQTNRSLHISTPMMMTWGISDFTDEKGDSDGKFSIPLNFPNEDYSNPSTDEFLKKMKDFENQILDDAVANSELWWGEKMSRELVKHTFFPFLKYSKNKDTKKIDLTKPPSIRAKVPCYDGKWNVEIYDTKANLLFPCENDDMAPMDFIPKQSNVACAIQCGGIWIGGKGWGLTWKLVQCVVKPREVVSVYGKCHIQLSSEDKESIETQEIEDDIMDYSTPSVVSAPKKVEVVVPVSTHADDSDEEDAPIAPETEPEPEPEQVAEPEPVAEPAPVVVKKVIKKAVVPVAAPVVAAVSEEKPAVPAVKKIIKKKVV